MPKREASALQLVYSRIHAAWLALAFGSPCSIDTQTIFPSLADAESACQACGLALRKRAGHIYDVVIGD